MKIALWLMFEAGVLLQVAAQINASLGSSSNALKGFEGVKTWLRSHLVPLVIRFAFANGLFGMALGNKAALEQLFGFPIPINAASSIFLGFTADSALDKIVAVLPWFKVEIPQIAPSATVLNGAQNAPEPPK